MYQVVKVPREGGSVYTIAPVQNLGMVRHVHCSMLKVRVQRQASPDPVVGSAQEPASSVSSEPSYDLCVWLPEEPISGPAPQVAV